MRSVVVQRLHSVTLGGHLAVKTEALVDRMGGESDRSYDSRDLRCNPGCLLYSVPQVCHYFSYNRRAAYGRTAWPTAWPTP